MFYSHTLSFLLLVFANVGCNESVANEAVYRPADCAETTSVVPKIAKTNPGGNLLNTKAVPSKTKKSLLDSGPSKVQIQARRLQKLHEDLGPKSKTAEPKKEDPTKEDPKKVGDKVNINDASATELETLPGIGPALAKRILDYRTKRKFKRLRDIRRVKGIGRAKFAKLKDKIRIK